MLLHVGGQHHGDDLLADGLTDLFESRRGG